MMTRAATPGRVLKVKSFINKLRWIKEAGPVSGGYPLYRLAPSRDLGVRRVRLSSLIGTGTAEPGTRKGKKAGSTVLDFPKPGKPAALILALLGLDSGGTREPLVRVAKVQGNYIIEKGWERLTLASVIGLDYICVRVIEYDYDALKKKMRIFRFPEGTMVGVQAGDGKRYSYHGVGDGELDLLLGRHRIPFIDSAAAPTTCTRVSAARAGGGTAPVRAKRQLKLVHSVK